MTIEFPRSPGYFAVTVRMFTAPDDWITMLAVVICV